jgi:geranylgeranyl reductase family protein
MRDVVIVGAGPAGCAAALTLTKAGRTPLLIEKAGMPRHKHCAGGLTRSTFEALIQLDIPYSQTVQQHYSHVMLSCHDVTQRFCIAENFASSTYRDVFDDVLVRHAIRHGAELCIDTVTCIEVKKSHVLIHTAGGGRIQARAVIGADGIHSTVRRSLQIPYSHDQLGIGYECEIPVSRRSIDQTYGDAMHLDFSYLPAGVWAFPKRKGGTVNVGLGFARSDQQRLLHAPYAMLNEFIQNQELGSGVCKQNIHAAVLPLQGTCAVLGRDSVILVGDAGGFVDPPSGEGIAYALQSGILAGESLEYCLKTNDNLAQRFTQRVQPMVTSINRYGIALRKLTLQLFTRGFLNPQRFINLLASDPIFTDIMQKIYTKRMTYRQALKKLLLKAALGGHK